ncbi:MAG TPA: hypothetical protein VLX92_20210 [Kofleriaceae bacterium]|nr:hypothetical protein [Kofleriaceae bacterium]
MKVVALLGVLAVGGVAHAGPTARFGLTYGVADQAAPDGIELAPLVAVGDRLGPLVGEVEWAYLSFFDPDASPGGVQRLGVTLRADLYQTRNPLCRHLACTRATTIYGEAGAAARWGHWVVGPSTLSPDRQPQPEAHLGVGLELDNRVHPNRDGWQFGVRFSLAPADPEVTGLACRAAGSSTCVASTRSGGLDKAVFLEWMFVIGK